MIANIHKYMSFPYQAAFEFIMRAIEPGEMSLAGMFFIHQPDTNDETVNLSQIYLTGGSFDSFNLSEALQSIDLTDYDTLRDIIKLIRDSGYTGKLSEFIVDSRKIEGLYESDYVTSSLSEIEYRLDSTHVLLLKLAIFSVNTIGSEAHEWAIDYLNYLAYELAKDGKLDFSVYESDRYSNVNTEIFQKLLELGYKPRFTLSDYDNSKPDYYLDDKRFYHDVSQAVIDWNEEESTDIEEEKIYDWIDNNTPHSVNRYDYKDSIKPIILYWISELCKAWNDGNLSLSVLKDDKFPALSEFTYQVNSQFAFDL